MTFRLVVPLLALLALTGAAQSGKSVRDGQKIEWAMADGRQVFRQGDVTATFAMVQCAPLGEDCEDGDMNPVLTLSRAGGPPLTLDGSSMQNFLMIGRLSKDGGIAAFFQTYSGGMHCCQILRVALPEGGAGWKLVELGSYDGEALGWPRDLDGDGVRDFVVRDDRFLYAFASYGGSWSPPKILNIVDGAVRDVSAEPRFARAFERAAAETRKACIEDEYPNGACAAYAANAARLGQFDAAWKTILAEYDRKSRVWPDYCKVVRREEDGECPEGQLIEYPDYPTALRAFLADLGYLPESA
ncbi:hypothetical protein [Sphingomonas suaedae]|uniref:hypothetical protein n=1 Tax=Sphingomonas suaedae TaxID=2599297 RepID=UPI001646717C|nr:hypothetical protein [Sphingomonas suaedae]